MKPSAGLPPIDSHSKSSTKITHHYLGSLDKRSNSRTLLRSTGKYALLSQNSASVLDNVMTKSGFSSTLNLSSHAGGGSFNHGQNKLPKKEVGVITMEELEGLRLRATGMDDKT